MIGTKTCALTRSQCLPGKQLVRNVLSQLPQHPCGLVAHPAQKATYQTGRSECRQRSVHCGINGISLRGSDHSSPCYGLTSRSKAGPISQYAVVGACRVLQPCRAVDRDIGGYTPSDYITWSDDPKQQCHHQAEVVVDAPVGACFSLWMDWTKIIDFLDLIGQVCSGS